MSCPSDIRASINVSSTVLVNWTEPVALDNGDLAPQVTVVPPGISPPHKFNKTTLVVYTARDASGNKKDCSFKVVLEGESERRVWGIALFTVSFSHLHYNVIQRGCEAISG